MTEFLFVLFILLLPFVAYVLFKLPQFNSVKRLMDEIDDYFSEYQKKFPYLSSNKCPECGSLLSFRKGVEGYFWDCTNIQCFFVKRWGW